jgi:hypothetical protein
MLPTKCRFIWPNGFRGEESKNQPIRKKNRLWWPCLLMDRDGMSNLYRVPSIDASYQVSVYLAKLCQSRRFLEIDQSETRIACGCHVDKMSNLYKMTFHKCFLPSFGSFVHSVSEEKIFRNRPIRNNNRLWWPCLSMDRDE